MSIPVYKDTKIYVVAPANAATGGPELLHQLVYHLRNDLNLNAFMYYLPDNHPEPVHPEYKMYNNPYVREVEDNEKNLLIVPEVIYGIKLLSKYSEIRKVIWWLSVDNFILSYISTSKTMFFTYRFINKLSKNIFKTELINLIDLANNNKNFQKKIKKFILSINSNYHFVQSHYAFEFLIKHNIPNYKIYYLSDYLNKSFLKIKTDLSKKENIVTYNPKKGLNFTKKIMRRAPEIKFVPLVNMTRQQVIETLQKAKVYIDFGNHPGKDRIPREAAILGCCIITGKRGSAKYFEDVPIPEEYKFEDKEENIPKIINKIKDCFENFEEKYKDFNYYREVIKKEPEKFIQDLKNIFAKT